MFKKYSLILLTALLTAVITSCLPAAAGAQDWDYGGEVSQGLIYQISNQEVTSAPTDLKLEMKKDSLDGKIYLSARGQFDWQKNEGSLELDEAYAAFYLNQTDMTIGRQVINWGTADGFNPTSSINPRNFNSLTSGEINGTPVISAQAAYYGDGFDLTGVVVPRFVPQEIGDLTDRANSDDPMVNMISQTINQAYEEADTRVPLNLENMEFALRYGTRVSGYDLRFSYYHGREDLPALIMIIQNGTPSGFQADYRRIDKLGLATAGGLGNEGVWAELAYVIPEKLDLVSPGTGIMLTSLSLNRPYLQAVIGVDHTFEDGLYGEMQYIFSGNGSLMMPYKMDPTGDFEPGQYLMNRLTYDLNWNNSLELTGINNLKDGSWILMPALTHNLNQVTDIKVGPVLTTGEDGEFSTLPDQWTVSIKTSF